MPIKAESWKDCARLFGILEAQSQLPIRFGERNPVFDVSRRIQHANFARAKTRAANSVINRLILIQENWLDAMIRTYDEAGNVIDTHEHIGDLKQP